MKRLKPLLILFFVLNAVNSVYSQIDKRAIENALFIVEKNKSHLENVGQILVVYNYKPETSSAVFVALEKKENHWIVKQQPIEAGIGKKGFALPLKKIEGDGKSPTGILKLGKLFSYEKQTKTRLENQQTTKEDKWIDDPNSADYNKYVSGFTTAKSFENLLLKNDAYKYCTVIEYNTNPVIKGKGSAIFLHLAIKKPFFTAGCVAIKEEYMKLIVNWLDPKENPTIIMGNLDVLKAGL
jgi:L,D-peptidoglycan transpeptidase YkuD (ErfK/YbiS/YcfS/YnhG family)